MLARQYSTRDSDYYYDEEYKRIRITAKRNVRETGRAIEYLGGDGENVAKNVPASLVRA